MIINQSNVRYIATWHLRAGRSSKQKLRYRPENRSSKQRHDRFVTVGVRYSKLQSWDKMGRKQHQGDKLWLTTQEWKYFFGGKKPGRKADPDEVPLAE